MHKVSLDRQDVRILEILQRDARISRIELADVVNLSASQCYRRLKRLESSGLIERYVTLLNREKAGFDVQAMVMVSFSKTEHSARDQLLRYVTLLNREKAGFDVQAMVMVSFSKTEHSARDQLLALIQSLDEVQECYSASGEYDFILRVNCTGMRAYANLINKKLLNDFVIAIHSYILLDCLKYSTALQLDPS